MLNNIYQAIMQFLFPSHCPSCNAYVEQKGMWCSSCLEEIIRNENKLPLKERRKNQDKDTA